MVQRSDYKGAFLPGFIDHPLRDPINKAFKDTGILYIDHVVGNQTENEMEPTVEWYEKFLDFHRFWSVDDKIMHTEYSALNSIVIADFDEVIKMPVNEPAKGKKKSQIQEYVDYYIGAGVQHIAFRTENIIESITALTVFNLLNKIIPNSSYNRKEELNS